MDSRVNYGSCEDCRSKKMYPRKSLKNHTGFYEQDQISTDVSLSNVIEVKNNEALNNAESNISKEVDGVQAWLMLASVFVLNATTLGSLKVYGLIFEEMVGQGYSRKAASWSISTATAIQNLAGILTPILSLRFSWRTIELTQTFLLVLANVGAYFSSGLALDILFLGVIQGVALSIRYNMNVVINNEYFSKYRATAMGVSLAGSTSGVLALKPIITYVLDHSDHNYRKAYLVLGIIMSFNVIFNLCIRKPRGCDPQSQANSGYSWGSDSSSFSTIVQLLMSPGLHCIWIMQTIYFYISRTYTIFIVDYGNDIGFDREYSRSLLEFWVYGELIGRLFLGLIIDSRFMSLKWSIVIVNLLLALVEFSLIAEPKHFPIVTNNSPDRSPLAPTTISYYIFAASVSLVAALSSLVNMLILPFGQEYLGKKLVPWAFATASIITSVFLIVRPVLIGASRDYEKSYSLLIMIMAAGPFAFSILFLFVGLSLRGFGSVQISHN